MAKMKVRNSIFEFLRLLAMFMVVLEHCLNASVPSTCEPLTVLDNIKWFLEAFTICAVNCFFLLTGYYLKAGRFRLSRLVGIWGKTVFYSEVIYLFAVALGVDKFSMGNLLFYLCPVLTKRYWFMQTYIVLSLLAPFIVILLDRLSEYQHLILISILLLFFSLHQTFIPVARTLDTTQGYGIMWGGILVIVGNFLQKYGEKYLNKVKGAYLLLGYAVVAVGIFITNCIIVKYDIAQGVTSRGNFYAYNSVSVFLEGMCLFLFFMKTSKRKNTFSNSVINWLASSALSVYLISAHPEFLFPLWTRILKLDKLIYSPAIYVLAAISLSIIVMLICILIDKFINLICRKAHFDTILRRLDETRLNKLMNIECN